MFDKGIIGWMMDINPTKYTVKNQKMINCIFESQYDFIRVVFEHFS